MKLHWICATALALTGCSATEQAASAPPGSYLLVLNKADSSLAVVEPNSGSTRDIAGTGEGPHEVAGSRDGTIAVVANYGAQTPGHTLSVFGMHERRMIQTIDISPHTRPHGI